MRIFVPILVFVIFFASCATKKGPLVNPNSSVTVKGSTTGSHSSSTNSQNTTKNTQAPALSGLSYIEKYKDIAIREMNQYGIPASIKLAQALLESGNGNSYLAKEANNHFGIKCGGVWNGKSVTRADDNPNDCFRVYNNPEDSFKDHSAFLLRKRYENLFKLDKNDYKGWAKGLKEAGYATNPRYPELLIDLIERYELYQYDRQETIIEKTKREDKVEHVIAEKQVSETPVRAEQIKAPVAMIIHEVKAGQTLYAISKQYSTSVDRIKTLNNLTTENLSVGQLLVVSK